MKFTSKTRPARELLVDDWFRMGGTLYRVVDTNVTASSIVLHAIEETGDPSITLVFQVPSNTPIKVYNQK